MKFNFYKIYKILLKNFGFQNWWPAKTKFEIIVGAILTQQTSWKNVEKAIQNLRKNKMLSKEKIKKAKIKEIEKLIKNVNFYKTKARRLKLLVKEMEKIERIKNKKNKEEIKKRLLSLKGIGEETAEVLMLYYFNQLDFVIDSYTLRIFERIYKRKFRRNELKELIQKSIPRSLRIYKDFHAQLDELGKRFCKKEPRCNECILNKICEYANTKQK
ncbi:MAG: endonuclease III domain-containing protein [Candidatus Micrarchaeales archaeon]